LKSLLQSDIFHKTIFQKRRRKNFFRARYFTKVFSEKNKKPYLEQDFSQNRFPKKVKSLL
jgi:hypothetical protein